MQAGLFSAVVTGFIIAAYSSLQPNSVDRSVDVLERISLQLSSFAAAGPFINSTASALPPAPTFVPTTPAIAINILWFLSLTLALMAALFAFSAQQWSRNYNYIPNAHESKNIRIRQRRLDAIDRWAMESIIAGPVILLQAALFLFFGGLLVFLWTIDDTVAIVITFTIAFFSASFVVMVMLPTFAPDCPYKSSLAWGFRVFASWAMRIIAVFLAGQSSDCWLLAATNTTCSSCRIPPAPSRLQLRHMGGEAVVSKLA